MEAIVEVGIEGYVDTLAGLMRRELQEYGALVQMMEEQQGAILRREHDAIMEYNERIEEQFEVSHEAREERERYVVEIGRASGMERGVRLGMVIGNFSESAQMMLKALMNDVVATVRKTEVKAEQNYLLLSRMRQLSEEIIRMAVPGLEPKMYGGKGGKLGGIRGSYMSVSA